MKLQSAEAALIWSRCWGTKVDRSPGSGRDSGGVTEQIRPHKASFQMAPTAARKGPYSKSGSPTSPHIPPHLAEGVVAAARGWKNFLKHPGAE